MITNTVRLINCSITHTKLKKTKLNQMTDRNMGFKYS